MTFCPQNEELEQAFSVYHSNKEVLLKEVEERGQRLEREQQEKEDIKKVRWGTCEREGNVLCIRTYVRTYGRCGVSVTYMYIYVYERCGVREKRYVGVGVREIADVKVLCIVKVLQSALCMYVYTYVKAKYGGQCCTSH